MFACREEIKNKKKNRALLSLRNLKKQGKKTQPAFDTKKETKRNPEISNLEEAYKLKSEYGVPFLKRKKNNTRDVQETANRLWLIEVKNIQCTLAKRKQKKELTSAVSKKEKPNPAI